MVDFKLDLEIREITYLVFHERGTKEKVPAGIEL